MQTTETLSVKATHRDWPAVKLLLVMLMDLESYEPMNMIMSVFANASTCEQFVCCLCPDTSLVSGPCWGTFEWPENASEAKGGRSFESLRSAVALAQFVLIILLIDVMSCCLNLHPLP